MNVTCTSCDSEFPGLAEPPERGGTPWTCPLCKTTITIPLYCPTCDPPAKAKKTYLETPPGFLGGTPQKCPKGHTFTVKVKYSESEARLAAMGNCVGKYQQKDRTAGLADPGLKRAVRGGFCHGAVLDWIRRALLGGKSAFVDTTDANSLTTQMTQRQIRQDTRVAIAHTKIDPARDQRKAALPGIWVKAGNVKNQTIEDADTKYRDLYRRIEASTKVDDDKKMEMIKRITADYKKAETEANALYENVTTELRAQMSTDRPLLKHFWATYAKTMDEVLAADRQTRGKEGQSVRGFGNLKVVHSIYPKEFLGGVAELARETLRHSQFTPNRAAFVGITPPRGAGGHAIAIHRLNTGDKYHLFDPNFGVYELTGAKVLEVMLYLFTVHYPHSAGDGNDDHPYEVNGKTKGEYNIFESALPAVQSVTVDPIQLNRRPAEQPAQLKPLQVKQAANKGPRS